MNIEIPSEQSTHFAVILAAADRTLTAAAFSASFMSAVARDYGTKVPPAICRHYSTKSGTKTVWEADLRVLPGYGPLHGDLDLSILWAGLVGEVIGLGLHDKLDGSTLAKNLEACAGDLEEQCKRYGMPLTNMLINRPGATEELLVRFGLLHDKQVFSDALNLIRAAMEFGDRHVICLYPKRAAQRPIGRAVINRKQLRQKVPMSERTILEMEKRGEFPKRFAITPRLVGWDLLEVEAWIARQHAAAVQQPVFGRTQN